MYTTTSIRKYTFTSQNGLVTGFSSFCVRSVVEAHAKGVRLCPSPVLQSYLYEALNSWSL